MIKTDGVLWHSSPESKVLEYLLSSDQQGLSTSEVVQRQEQFGLNALLQKKDKNPLFVFLQQFNQPLIYILLVASAVTAFLKEWVDSSVIFGVVIVNAVIGFIQEIKAMKSIKALAKSMLGEATVIRDGKKQRIPSSQLTLGDIVLLQSGDRVPADIRIIQLRELQINESALTGESVPVEKKIGVIAADTVLADRLNMAYSATLVTYGIGTGVVTAIGDATEVGRINQMVSSADILETPLTKRIARFSKLLLYAILALAAVTFIVGRLRGGSMFDMFMSAVALAVAAIPEGLPAALTITLAIGVSKMAKRNAIIRKLPAVETMGSITVICSDKTGTLTQNQMTVQRVYASGKLFSVSGVGYSPDDGIFTQDEATINPDGNYALRECMIAGLLCNDSNLIKTDGGWKVEGDPTEGALISSALKSGLSRETIQKNLPRIDVIPFESQHQYMATLHDAPEKDRRVIYIKGSVESILARCTSVLLDTGSLDAFDKNAVLISANTMADSGLRVLAFARRELPKNITAISHEYVKGEFSFLGLQAIIDPPRLEVVKALQACRSAGIHVKMITGDHELTALSIARKIGMIDKDKSREQSVINGKKLSQLSDHELIKVVGSISVFARVVPEDKIRIVRALQYNGEIVAMTGDGVNDAPALRQANIGIAMGISGTEVAKEAADMVITDDNFASIEAAVEEGRGIYDNIIKFITWTLPTNIGEGLVVLTAIFAGSILPILPVQILWVNMTTAVLLGLTLAFEPKEPDIMNNSPRPPQQPIITGQLLFRLVMVGVLLLAGTFWLFGWVLQSGRSEAVARTVAVNVFVLGELFYLFNCRSLQYSMFKVGFFSNTWALVGVVMMVVLQIFFTYLPFMNTAFSSAPISLTDWVFCIGVGMVIYVLVEMEKMLRRKIYILKV